MQQVRTFVSTVTTLLSTPRILAAIYFFCALTAVSLLALLIPPFENADEFNHFSRADQILSGTLIARRTNSVPPQSGGVVDLGINRLDAVYGVVRFHPDVKVSAEMTARGAAIRMGERGFQPFSNTTIYSPLLYAPSVAGLAAARIFHVGRVTRALEMSRLANGLVCVSLATLAIVLAGSAAAFVTVVLSLPMTLSLFSAVSQDGLMICASALTACCLLRILSSVGPACAEWRTQLSLFAGLTVMSLGRPAYAPLLLAPLLLWPAVPEGRSRRRVLWFCAASIGVIGLWSVIVRVFVIVPLWGQASPGLQLRNLLHHPGLIPQLTVAALTDHQGMGGMPFWKEMVGVLGWGDTQLPEWFYSLSLIAAGAACLTSCRPLPAVRPAGVLWQSGLAVLLAGSVTLIFLLEYLTFTPVGQTYIVGVQGRYFLPLLAFLPLLLPAGQRFVLPQPARNTITALVPVCMIVSIIVTLHAVLVRFYVI
ncbi:DUF2142 domain-containing protein [Acetobacter musti]|uniref:DUF2142 domain-containing protein n=1 Tax=Acetobacter musti TaxID=864732 RepID=A0ABX0JNP9_9PROT|nr:DUF2142 domain-containing protein [Acetobacter musti]NHN85043.1 DUF2142 domain-containing protein [Acetobacter musti]